MLDQSIVFVDLETTGADPAHDRVIEIGVVKVAGGELEYEWQTLVDPQQPIPPAVQGVTGISDDMVRGAPSFSRVGDELAERLGDSLFIAHNARFDVGFLRSEFRRLGRPFEPQVLCTVKLSRALYPQHHRHGLDAIMARHGLACSARHRALGDARVLWDFVQLLQREHAPEVIDAALAKAMRQPVLPPHLAPDTLDVVPESPGVYLFYGENDALLYVGRGINLRARILSHFCGNSPSSRAPHMHQDIRRVDWIETAGELGALLLEARLLKEKMPIRNRHLPRGEPCTWRMPEHSMAGPAVEVVPARDIDPREPGRFHGLFRSRPEAVNTLREIAAAHQLCPRRLGLEAGRGPCSAFQVDQCLGVCAGRESVEAHDSRLRAALSSLRLKSWPFSGRIAIREANPERGREQFHIFESWSYIGTEATQADLFEAAQSRFEPLFDFDTYKILTRYLARRPSGIIELARPAASSNAV